MIYIDLLLGLNLSKRATKRNIWTLAFLLVFSSPKLHKKQLGLSINEGTPVSLDGYNFMENSIYKWMIGVIPEIPLKWMITRLTPYGKPSVFPRHRAPAPWMKATERMNKGYPTKIPRCKHHQIPLNHHRIPYVFMVKSNMHQLF